MDIKVLPQICVRVDARGICIPNIEMVEIILEAVHGSIDKSN